MLFRLTTAIYAFITPSLNRNPTFSHRRYKIMTTKRRQSIPGRKKYVILFSKASISALAPTRLSIPGVAREFSRRLKGPQHETDHEPPYNTEVKDECSYTCTPSHALLKCIVIYFFLSYLMESTPVNVQSLDEEYL